eukprot:CAMPEP_0201662330 /NCGR_PEP_ID=MMETSP0494-20130426/4442_1 /ASSEMBLY_ACC=CAM_ASM_000839 /TAXON_ID=420259 /ORGANISM="Thalassiosira gravida, Strain GMp14c1" /LENGTH=601 /DNA_ID=CAMNT_0048140661 /DNA_START=326 /DNA_END=2127 /DNA_ORIENTATION=-
MGLCTSKPSYIASSSGGEREYQERFLESKTLGQGEFGIVKLVHDVKRKDLIDAKPLAVKYLKKGFTFRDNTLYTPLKKKVLQSEVEILRSLNGECYNLKLVAVYESSSLIYMVTEYCEGGEMVPWVSTAFNNTGGGLRTEDVSRVCYQLWSAVDHCARHNVIHRDIKPENVMFCTTARDSELRLIDFGSGTMDGLEQQQNPDQPQSSNGGEGSSTNNNNNNAETNNKNNNNNNNDDVERHHTFAGSAFYISPEMFQKTYTNKTDVWSAAATLYVLVAGYPADQLQEAFNTLQSSKEGRVRNLPNLPDNMPDSFYDMLEGALVYRHKQRKDACQLMTGEFAQFHIQHQKQSSNKSSSKPGVISIHEIAAEAAGEYTDQITEMTNNNKSNFNPSGSIRTTSVVLEGSVHRHAAYLNFQKFERSVTTVLATMLSKDTCKKLLLLLREQHKKVKEKRMSSVDGSGHSHGSKEGGDDNGNNNDKGELDATRGRATSRKANAQKLQVVTIKVLLEELGDMEVEDVREVKEVIVLIQALKNFNLYENFAYHISLLRQFVSLHTRNARGGGRVGDSEDKEISSVHGQNVWSSLRKKRGLGGSHNGGGGG